MKHRASFDLVALFISLVFVVAMKIRFEHLKMDSRGSTLGSIKWRSKLAGLPRGIVEPASDMEMKPLWEDPRLKDNTENYTALLALAVGISQKQNVDIIVCKFLMENCSIILFHYDGNVDGWHDLEWSNKAIHILAHNQTKWWFAKRFLHPDVVSIYDYIFLWDEDIGVENFHPGRYLQIMASEGLEISQPALDPDLSSDIHHRITIRNRMSKVHRRVYDFRGSLNCSDESRGPPCTGWVEGMAPVFSRAAWRCVWELIQNDLIHGWGLDMKLGYCAQGDRTKKVGVIDSEFIVHQGIPTLGGSSADKFTNLDSLEAALKSKESVLVQLGSSKAVKSKLDATVKKKKNFENQLENERLDQLNSTATSTRSTTPPGRSRFTSQGPVVALMHPLFSALFSSILSLSLSLSLSL